MKKIISGMMTALLLISFFALTFNIHPVKAEVGNESQKELIAVDLSHGGSERILGGINEVIEGENMEVIVLKTEITHVLYDRQVTQDLYFDIPQLMENFTIDAPYRVDLDLYSPNGNKFAVKPSWAHQLFINRPQAGQWRLHFFTEGNYRVLIGGGPSPLGSLSNYDALILPLPLSPYTAIETNWIKEFANSGKGLALISDGGWGVYPLNQIATGFGFRFEYDLLLTEKPDPYSDRYPPVSRAQDGVLITEFASHPVADNVKQVNCMWGGHITILDANKAQPLAWGNNSVYTNTPSGELRGAGCIFAAVSKNSRVFGMTDSNIFEPYRWSQYLGDNQLFIQNLVTWLLEPEEWSFAIIADLHVGFYWTDYDSSGFADSGGDPGQDYFLTDRLKKTVEWINTNKETYKIRFAVALGDISDTGEFSEFEKARDILNLLNDPNADGDTRDGIPYIPIIGNHDIWPYTEKDLPFYYHLRPKEQIASSNIGDFYFNTVFWDQNTGNLQKIEELFGDWRRQYTSVHILQDTGQPAIPQNYVFSYEGVKFIALDFVERKPDSSGPVLYTETLSWLSENVIENKPTILLSHHPIYHGPLSIMKGMNWWQAGSIGQIIASRNGHIMVNFAGHNHFNLEATAESNTAGIKVISTEGLCRESTWWGSGYLGKTGLNVKIFTMSGGEPKDYLSIGIGDGTEKLNWYSFVTHSPVDIAITDPDGIYLTKGMGEVEGMYYFESDIDGDGEVEDVVALAGLKLGDYGIDVIPEAGASPTDTFTLEFLADGMTIVLAENVRIGDIPTQPYIVRSTEAEVAPIVPATVDFDPDVLNLRSIEQWVTVYIELPTGHGYDVSMIDKGTLRLNGQVKAEVKPIKIGDYDGDGIPDLMVKFSRKAVQNILNVGDKVEITISGKLIDGRLFEGKDTIKVICPP